VDYDPRYLTGVLLFNRQDYFEAHEAWEDLWAESHESTRRFYQGLIQAAVGLCHFANGNLRGALKLYRTSRGYMEGLETPFLGVDLPQFWKQMDACFAELLTNPEAAAAPILSGELLPAIELAPAPEEWPVLSAADGAEHEEL
jgi:predicted metal-dependent hydrolase